MKKCRAEPLSRHDRARLADLNYHLTMPVSLTSEWLPRFRQASGRQAAICFHADNTIYQAPWNCCLLNARKGWAPGHQCHWDGCCTRCCSSARVTRGRPHLPLLLFIYSLSSDPTQGSKDGSGHPQIPNMVFSLLHMPWLWRKSIISNLWWWVSLHLPFQPQNSNSWHGFVL